MKYVYIYIYIYVLFYALYDVLISLALLYLRCLALLHLSEQIHLSKYLFIVDLGQSCSDNRGSTVLQH